MRIKNWDKTERPREKLLLKGKENLSDAELLAIIIGSGNEKENAVILCQNILKAVNQNLHELGKFNYEDLQKFKGIGPAKALEIIAAIELGRRRSISEIEKRQKINNAQEAFWLMEPQLSDLRHEEFWIVLLDNSNQIIEKILISSGDGKETPVDFKKIFKNVLNKNACALLLFHNHPSGKNQASEQDIVLTQEIIKIANHFNIFILDHLIIYGKNYLSFRENNLI